MLIDGTMMAGRLTVASLARRAESVFPDSVVQERTSTGTRGLTYAQLVARARQLSSALQKAGIRPGDRVATFGWNTMAHLELYLAVPLVGAVLHTLNIRLHADDVGYIADHAGDLMVFVDESLRGTLPDLAGVRSIVVMNRGSSGGLDDALDYEAFLSTGDSDFEFVEVDENAAAAMCYTSGTTGRPKGVVYSHRSISLYCLIANQADAFGIGRRDVVMPVVPMFHANAWGLPYIALMSGAGLVLPGPAPTARDVADLVAACGVTTSAAVPTVWQSVVELGEDVDLSSLREVVCGGAAVPEALIRRFDARFGVSMVQGWGMTETSPLALISRADRDMSSSDDDWYFLRATQGRPLPFVDIALDAEAGGELLVSGPTVTARYFGEPPIEDSSLVSWLRTGDVAELRPEGFVRLVDRTKDLVKSGGEWISSVDLEAAALFHPGVAEAAVVAVPDERWGERPLMFVVARDGAHPEPEEIRTFLRRSVASWWVPERIEVIESIARTSVGKIDKVAMRRVAEAVVDPHLLAE